MFGTPNSTTCNGHCMYGLSGHLDMAYRCRRPASMGRRGRRAAAARRRRRRPDARAPALMQESHCGGPECRPQEASSSIY
jgi:hypothetical protein